MHSLITVFKAERKIQLPRPRHRREVNIGIELEEKDMRNLNDSFGS
jgi:hypothetical protein